MVSWYRQIDTILPPLPLSPSLSSFDVIDVHTLDGRRRRRLSPASLWEKRQSRRIKPSPHQKMYISTAVTLYKIFFAHRDQNSINIFSYIFWNDNKRLWLHNSLRCIVDYPFLFVSFDMISAAITRIEKDL
jgi:hypothetical protein